MITTFKEAEEYILDIPRFGGKNTLEDTKEFLIVIRPGIIPEKLKI